MKKISYQLVFALCAISGMQISAAPGCWQNRQHMNDNGYDYKTAQYVHCTCPCERHRSINGQCQQCGHYHELRNFV